MFVQPLLNMVVSGISRNDLKMHPRGSQHGHPARHQLNQAAGR